MNYIPGKISTVVGGVPALQIPAPPPGFYHAVDRDVEVEVTFGEGRRVSQVRFADFLHECSRRAGEAL